VAGKRAAPQSQTAFAHAANRARRRLRYGTTASSLASQLAADPGDVARQQTEAMEDAEDGPGRRQLLAVSSCERARGPDRWWASWPWRFRRASGLRLRPISSLHGPATGPENPGSPACLFRWGCTGRARADSGRRRRTRWPRELHARGLMCSSRNASTDQPAKGRRAHPVSLDVDDRIRALITLRSNVNMLGSKPTYQGSIRSPSTQPANFV
jgi:hypothetical protein